MIYIIIMLIGFAGLCAVVIVGALLSSKVYVWTLCYRCNLYYDICGEQATVPPDGSVVARDKGLCPNCQYETRVHRMACGKTLK